MDPLAMRGSGLGKRKGFEDSAVVAKPSSQWKLVFLSTDRYFLGMYRQWSPSSSGRVTMAVIIRPQVGVIFFSLQHLYAGRPRMQMI